MVIKYSNRYGLNPTNWILNEIQLKDIKMYDEFIKATDYPANLWSSNFAYLWARSKSPLEKVLWKVIDGMLITFLYTDNGYLQLPCLQFGSGSSDKVTDILYKCMQHCYKINGHNANKTMVRVINDSQLEYLTTSKNFNNYFRLKNLKGEDKHLGIQKLVDLQGSEFNKVRQKINKFHKTYPNAIIRTYDQSIYADLIKLKQHWNETAGRKYRIIHDDTYYHEIVKNYKELEHLILVIDINGEICGMISGGILPTGETWSCLSKKKFDLKGLSEVLLVEFAREINRLNPSAKLMNLGIDIGVGTGLKKFKDKFRPVLSSRRYQVFLK